MSRLEKSPLPKDTCLLDELKNSVPEESAQGDPFAVENARLAEKDLGSASGGALQPVLDACSCWCTGTGDISQCPGCGPG